MRANSNLPPRWPMRRKWNIAWRNARQGRAPLDNLERLAHTVAEARASAEVWAKFARLKAIAPR